MFLVFCMVVYKSHHVPQRFIIFAMAQICRIGHDHQAPFQVLLVLVLVLLLGISSGDTRRKLTTTWPIYPRPPIFLQILDPL